MVQFFDRYVRDAREVAKREHEELKARLAAILGRKPKLIDDSQNIGAGQTSLPSADNAPAQASIPPAPPQPLCPPLSPRLSPKSTPSIKVDSLQPLQRDPNDADSERPHHPIPVDDPTPVSSGRHNSTPFAAEGEQEASSALPPSNLPSPPQRKRKRDGPRSISDSGGTAKETGVGQVTEALPPAKRRALTEEGVPKAEGPPNEEGDGEGDSDLPPPWSPAPHVGLIAPSIGHSRKPSQTHQAEISQRCAAVIADKPVAGSRNCRERQRKADKGDEQI